MIRLKIILLALITAATWAWAVTDPEDMVFLGEVFADDAAATPRFVELYNASSEDVVLKNWRLRFYTSKGVEQYIFPESAAIPARGFFLVGRSKDSSLWTTSQITPDAYTSVSMDFVEGKGGVILYRDSGATRDTVGWGPVPAPYYESTPHLPAESGQSLERKSSTNHSEIGGNSYDSGDNSVDIRIRPTPQPQNTLSPREFPSAGTAGDAWGRIKAMYYGER